MRSLRPPGPLALSRWRPAGGAVLFRGLRRSRGGRGCPRGTRLQVSGGALTSDAVFALPAQRRHFLPAVEARAAWRAEAPLRQAAVAAATRRLFPRSARQASFPLPAGLRAILGDAGGRRGLGGDGAVCLASLGRRLWPGPWWRGEGSIAPE